MFDYGNDDDGHDDDIDNNVRCDYVGDANHDEDDGNDDDQYDGIVDNKVLIMMMLMMMVVVMMCDVMMQMLTCGDVGDGTVMLMQAGIAKMMMRRWRWRWRW